MTPETTPLAIALISVLAATSCSHSAIHRETPTSAPQDEKMDEVEEAWQRRFDGLISDLAISKNGELIAVATVPDPDSGKTRKTPIEIVAYDSGGRIRWRTGSPAQVKSLTVADDGRTVWVVSYDDRITALGPNGETLWQSDGTCKLIALDPARKVLCFHDDDGTPGTAWEALDWATGARVARFPPKPRNSGGNVAPGEDPAGAKPVDALVLKGSEDRTHFAFSAANGQVYFFNSVLEHKWKREVPGEVIDLAVSNSGRPRVAVLWRDTSATPHVQRITVFGEDGAPVRQGAAPGPGQQIEILPGGEATYVYSNSANGQFVSRFDVDGGAAGDWSRTDPRYADYTSSMLLSRELAIIGVEDNAESAQRHTHILAFNKEGRIRWNLPFVTHEGAYLYSQAWAEKNSLLILATDDGLLSAYKVILK